MLTVPQFIESCREKGLNVTYQRILIYKSLVGSKFHPTAEEIYHQVKSEYPSISLATVYKTLETLADHSLISKVTPLHDLARYDGDVDPHHHLVCLHCRKVLDVHEDRFNQLDIPKHDGFYVSGYRIQFEGTCENCALAIKNHQKGQSPEGMTFCGKQ